MPRRRDPIVIALLGIASAYPALFLDRGWIPHDDGMLGQTALRVLTGELPHRDFVDVYTGGLAYWNAASFVLFGIDLLAPRLLLLAAFLGFLAALYALGSRFVAPRSAAAATLCVSVWSLPNYPAAMPTWYNLFLAVGALWAFVRFTETNRPAWLVGAGLASGLSLVVKSVGLYTVAALLMALAVAEAGATDARGEGDGEPRDSGAGGPEGVGYRALMAGGLTTFVALVVLLVRRSLSLVDAAHFVVPSAAVAGLTLWCVLRSPAPSAGSRLRRYLRLTVPYGAGVAVPVILFAVPYALTGSLHSLVQGTLILPLRRLTFATASPLPLSLFAPAVPILALLALAALARGTTRLAASWTLTTLLACVVVLGGRDQLYRGTWGALLALTPLTVVAVAGLIAHRWTTVSGERIQRRRLVQAAASVAVLGTFTLIQYPFSGPVYFFYVAPLVVLILMQSVALAGPRWNTPAAVMLAFALAFGARWVATASLMATAQGRYERRMDTQRLDLDRGGIRVSPGEKAEYERLAGTLASLAPNGVTYVTPDAPEAYFLSGLRNPTPTLYDFLDAPRGRTQRILETLEREDVRVVALNRVPQFSGPPPRDLVEALESRYPKATGIGRFIVRWR